MSLNVPFARGRNIRFSLRQNGVKVIAAFKTNRIEELADEGADPVNGEDRDRFWLVTNGYRVNLDGYAPDFALLDSFLADTANDDLSNPPLAKLIQVTVNLLDGSTVAYRLSGTGSSRGPFNIEVPDRKSAIMQACSYRFQRMAQVTI